MADNFPNAPVWPFGAGSERTASKASGTLTIDPVDDALIDLKNTSDLTGNLTIALANIVSGLPIGSKIRLKVSCGGTGKTISFGSNVTGVNISIGANTTQVIEIEKLQDGFHAVSNKQVA